MSPVIRLAVLTFVCTPILLAGCDTTPEQRMAIVQSYIDAGQRASVSLDDAIAATELVLDQAVESLKDPNLPEREVAEILALQEQAKEQVAAFRAKKLMLDRDLAQWRDMLAQAQTGGGSVADEIHVYSQGVKALGNQVGGNVGGYISLAGTLVAAISGAVAGMAAQRRKTQQTQQTLEGVVGSVSALLSSSAVPDAEQAKTVLQSAQLPAVRQEVRKVLGKS